MLGTPRARDVVPLDVDRLLVATVARGAPTVANELLRYLVRLFKHPMVLGWATGNPAASFGLRDAGGRERARTRWLPLHELIGLARAMRTCERFGRENELGMWLLLALCVRKMELLSAGGASLISPAGSGSCAGDAPRPVPRSKCRSPGRRRRCPGADSPLATHPRACPTAVRRPWSQDADSSGRAAEAISSARHLVWR